MEVRFFAGAAEAAGAESREVDAAGLTAAEVVQTLADGNARLGQVLSVSSLLADGARVTDPTIDMSQVRSLDVLPPFAGG